MAKESTGRSATVAPAPATSDAAVPGPRPRLRRSLRRSRTFLHRSVGAQRRNVAQVYGIYRLHRRSARNLVRRDVDRADRFLGAPLRGTRPLAIERQPHRDARALADPAANRNLAAMQTDEAL